MWMLHYLLGVVTSHRQQRIVVPSVKCTRFLTGIPPACDTKIHIGHAEAFAAIVTDIKSLQAR